MTLDKVEGLVCACGPYVLLFGLRVPAEVTLGKVFLGEGLAEECFRNPRGSGWARRNFIGSPSSVPPLQERKG